MAVRASQVIAVLSEKKNGPGALGKVETINQSYSAIVWDTKETFPAPSLVSYKKKRKHKVKNSATRGTRIVEQVSPL